MRILVCGATGYLGKHIARGLREAGHEILGLARNESASEKVASLGFTPVEGDMKRPESLVALLDRVDAVVSVAQVMLDEEYRAARAMLEALEGSDKFFIQTSGTGLVSQKTDGAWSEDSFAEDDPFVPSKYLGARLETENMVRSFATRGVRAMVIRPPLMWGHGECKPIADFYRSAAETGAVCYLGAGLNLYSNVHVDDLAQVYVLALQRGVPGALYHAVSGEQNYRTIAETVARHLGVPTRSIDFPEAVQLWDKFTALISFSVCSRSRSPRTRRELGWAPHPDRLDFLAEVVNPAFQAGMTAPHKIPSGSRAAS